MNINLIKGIKNEFIEENIFKKVYNWYFTINNVINKIMIIENPLFKELLIYHNSKLIYESDLFTNLFNSFNYSFKIAEINYMVKENKENKFELFINSYEFDFYENLKFPNLDLIWGNEINPFEKVDISKNIDTPFD